jgi:hypothetical protein
MNIPFFILFVSMIGKKQVFQFKIKNFCLIYSILHNINYRLFEIYQKTDIHILTIMVIGFLKYINKQIFISLQLWLIVNLYRIVNKRKLFYASFFLIEYLIVR